MDSSGVTVFSLVDCLGLDNEVEHHFYGYNNFEIERTLNFTVFSNILQMANSDSVGLFTKCQKNVFV